MPTLSELLPYLEQGATLRSSRGESLRPLPGGRIEWLKARGFRFEAEVIGMAEVRNISCIWQWEIVGNTQGKEGTNNA